jgi:hypothetical protein
MPQAQKRKCSVNFGELISFLSMTEAYSRNSLITFRTAEDTRSQGLPHGLWPRDEGEESRSYSTFIGLPSLQAIRRVLRKTVCIDRLSARQGLILEIQLSIKSGSS